MIGYYVMKLLKFESSLTEQRCSVNLSCVTFRFDLLLVRPLCC